MLGYFIFIVILVLVYKVHIQTGEWKPLVIAYIAGSILAVNVFEVALMAQFLGTIELIVILCAIALMDSIIRSVLYYIWEIRNQ